MSGPNFKIIVFGCLTFAWLYFANIATIWLVCRCVKTKQGLHFVAICQAIVILAGLCFGINVLHAIDADESIPKDQRALVGLVILFSTFALSAISSMLTVKFFFPKKWGQYWQIKSTFR